MKLEDLYLKKEEIKTFYQKHCGIHAILVPVHPRLVDEDLRFDPKLAHKVFPKAAEDWYNNDLRKQLEIEENENNRAVIKQDLNKKFSVKRRYNSWSVNPPGCWNDITVYNDNRGFAKSFKLDTNIAGSLILDTSFGDEYDKAPLNPPMVNFTPEKFLEYSCLPKERVERPDLGTLGYAYRPHNTGSTSGILLLKNWTIAYLNEAMKQIFSK